MASRGAGRFSYADYLATLDSYDRRCSVLAGLIREFPARQMAANTGDIDSDNANSDLVILDVVKDTIKQTLSVKLDDFGRPSEPNSGFREDIGNTIRPAGSSLRIIFLSYSKRKSTRNHVPSFNYMLLDHLGTHYRVHPHLYLPHFEASFSHRGGSEGITQLRGVFSLPSQRRVLFLRLGQLRDSNRIFSFTAQRCHEPGSRELETIIVIVENGSVKVEYTKDAQLLLSCLGNSTEESPDPRPLKDAVDRGNRPRFLDQFGWLNVSKLVFEMIKGDYGRTDTSMPLNGATIIAPVARMVAGAHMDYVRQHQEFITKRTSAATTDRNLSQTEPQKWMADLHKQIFEFRSALANVREYFNPTGSAKQHDVVQDFEFISGEYQLVQQSLQEALNFEATQRSLEASSLSLKESRLGIEQNKDVKRLTQLAFVFIPSSFIATIFGMNIDVLTDTGARWWTALVGMVIVYVLLGSVMVYLRLGRK